MTITTLSPRPKNDADFDNGYGYIQHTKEEVLNYKRDILLLCSELINFPDFKKWATTPDRVHNQSMIGRIIQDNNQELYKLWFRIVCIDEQNREWGQPYFVNHPRERKEILL